MPSLPPEPLSGQLAARLLPTLDSDRNKYSAGEVLLIGGVPGMEGAACLAAQAAIRSGAGIVKWLHEPEADPSRCPVEIVRINAQEHMDTVLRELSRAKTVLVGVGCSKEAPPSWIVEVVQVAQERKIPILWDGGALHWVKEGWVSPQAGDCLTPHRGELIDLESKALHDLQKAAEILAHRWGVTVVAKGPITWIFHPALPALASHEGDPGMASAGVGDVLSGLIAGFMAQGLISRDAAACALWLHSRAGRRAAAEQTSYCMTASSVLQLLPEAFKDLMDLRSS
jgi:hydroxyethylthiazole kinase-like uncharacterized protein yjeF